MKLLVSIVCFLLIFFSCKPEERNKNLVCQMPSETLKSVLDDIFVYESTKNSKALDSLSLSYSKNSVYQFIYQKHNTNRKEVQEAIECYTATKELVPLLKEIETSYKEWRDNPQFQFDESKDSIQ